MLKAVVVVVVASVLGACKGDRQAALPEGTPARVRLEAEVPGRPELVREVWANRMKAALDGGFLPLVSARAEIEGQRLVLDAELVAAGGCTPAKAEALGQALAQTATRSGRLGVHRVRVDDAEMLSRQLRDALPEAARVTTPHDLPGAVVVLDAGDVDVMALARPMVPPGLSLFKETAREPGQDKKNLRMWLVEEAPALDGRVVTRAWAQDNETGAPSVRVSLSDPGARAFADLTNEALKQPLPIVFEDEVVAAPIVVGRVEAGSLEITLPERLRGEARTIAAMLTSGGLRESPKILKLEATCKP